MCFVHCQPCSNLTVYFMYSADGRCLTLFFLPVGMMYMFTYDILNLWEFVNYHSHASL